VARRNAILGPALGIILLYYAAGIWRMRRYALYLGFAYAVYVTLNLVLYQARNPPPPSQTEKIAGFIYVILALAFSWGTAIILSPPQSRPGVAVSNPHQRER